MSNGDAECLLPQPGGFEGFRAIEEVLLPDHQAPSERELLEHRLAYGHALEGYCYAVLSTGSDFLEICKRVRDHAGLDPTVTRCTDENLELLWRTRNHFRHLGARGGYTPGQLEDALLPSCRWGHALMHAALLHDLGFSKDGSEDLFKRHYANWPLP